MKRFLTLLFVVAGFTFAGKLQAQVSTERPKADTSATQSDKKSSDKVTPAQGSGEGITIDESGTPKPKHKKQNSARTGNPKKSEAKQSAKSDDAGSPAPPSEIAIDESGSSKPKPKTPKANAPDNNDAPNKDTAIINQVGRPQ